MVESSIGQWLFSLNSYCTYECLFRHLMTLTLYCYLISGMVSWMEKAMAPHSSTLAWKVPWTEEPGRLQSMGSLESDMTEWLHFHFHALEKEMATHYSALAWRIPGTGKPGGLPSMGSHRVGHDWNDLAAAAACNHLSFWLISSKLQ